MNPEDIPEYLGGTSALIIILLVDMWKISPQKKIKLKEKNLSQKLSIS